jgi:hypothetical protein
MFFSEQNSMSVVIEFHLEMKITKSLTFSLPVAASVVLHLIFTF